jgi:prepilin-type processing-associated H-X9-DG protein/prepilin-type N-terminal cleavage/methylation domain-containing protein
MTSDELAKPLGILFGFPQRRKGAKIFSEFSLRLCALAGEKRGSVSASTDVRRGFTLWELLTVLFIAALLMAVLFPSYQYARDMTWKLYCMNNIREMVYAAHQYAYLHDGELPPAYRRDFTTRQTVTWESFLWGTNSQQRVQQCPVFKGSAMWMGDIFTGYNYNSSYLGGTVLVRDGVLLRGSTKSAKLFDIKNPSECAMFGDGEYESGANKFMRSPFPGDLDADASLALGGTQGFRHRGYTNVGFVDGHVESLKTRYTATAAYGAPAARCGFLSPDNSLYDLE